MKGNTMSTDAMARLNQWRVWADRRFLNAAATLMPEQLVQEFSIGQGTILKTLQHLQMAEEVWINRLTGRTPTALADFVAPPDLVKLKEAWDCSDGVWAQYVGNLTDAELKRFLTVTTVRWTTRMPVQDVILHVCTHASYTQAQGNNMLRHAGVKAVDGMLATMSREEFGT
jgi:uncharacterized damage-inducible protein DinB